LLVRLLVLLALSLPVSERKYQRRVTADSRRIDRAADSSPLLEALLLSLRALAIMLMLMLLMMLLTMERQHWRASVRHVLQDGHECGRGCGRGCAADSIAQRWKRTVGIAMTVVFVFAVFRVAVGAVNAVLQGRWRCCCCIGCGSSSNIKQQR
jgi:hypothetical protein